jgi:hypothetical protein
MEAVGDVNRPGECSGTVEVSVGDEELFRRRSCLSALLAPPALGDEAWPVRPNATCEKSSWLANYCVALRGPVELDTAPANYCVHRAGA